MGPDRTVNPTFSTWEHEVWRESALTWAATKQQFKGNKAAQSRVGRKSHGLPGNHLSLEGKLIEKCYWGRL